MRKIAAAACVVSICSASSVFAMDLVTKAPQQEEISQNSSGLQSAPVLDNNLGRFCHQGRSAQLAKESRH